MAQWYKRKLFNFKNLEQMGKKNRNYLLIHIGYCVNKTMGEESCSA
jgi:hypothetical protein